MYSKKNSAPWPVFLTFKIFRMTLLLKIAYGFFSSPKQEVRLWEWFSTPSLNMKLYNLEQLFSPFLQMLNNLFLWKKVTVFY